MSPSFGAYFSPMSVSSVSAFLAVLALTALLGGVGTVISHVLGVTPSLIRRHGLLAAWLVAAVSTGGSLYYSEVAKFTPCELCWWQRIAMYPLVLVLGRALILRHPGVRSYVLPVSLVGLGISAYHTVLQRFPSLFGSDCGLDAPCTGIWVDTYGFVSIPFMAMSGFVAIVALMLIQEKP